MVVRAWRWLGAVISALVLIVASATATVVPVAAQPACTTDGEPNGTPEEAALLAIPGCIEGTVPDGDQDLYLWTVTDADASSPWTIGIDGPARMLTSAQVFPITSEPGVVPISVASALLSVDHGPDDFGPVLAEDVLLRAGRYVLGVARSLTDDGSVVEDPAYRIEVRPGTPLPAPIEQEPNDEPAAADPVQDVFSLGGDLQGSYDHYRWSVTEAIAGTPVELRAAGPLGRGLAVELQGTDGTLLKQMDGFDTDRLGALVLRDLVLPVGDYILKVTPFGDDPFPYRLEAVPSTAADADPEPNDEPTQAVRLDPTSRVMRGRLTSADRRDRFVLVVDEALATRLLDVRLLWRDRIRRDVCLEDAEGRELQCRSGDQGVALPGLQLAEGSYLLEVRGDPAEWSSYILRVDDVGEALDDFESEPNGSTDQATPMLPEHPMAGRSSHDDDDFFALTVTGEPQLWQLDVTGHGLDHVSWVHRDGSDLVAADVTNDRDAATISDLYLVPGRHWFKVGGVDDGEYRFAFTPLGPPDPDAEREPNNAPLRAGPLRVGTQRTGRLVDGADIDVFRFTLDTQDHVRLDLVPAADGAVRMRLESGALRFADISAREPGTPITWDGVLQPGDYEAWVQPLVPSDDRYRLSLGRDDPFVVRTDLEPNDEQALASSVPPSLVVEGAGTPSGDLDWYRMPALTAGGDLGFRAEGPVTRLTVWDALREYPTERREDGGFLVAGLPPAEPLWLRVETNAADPYSIVVEPGTTGLPPAMPAPEALPVTIDVRAEPGVVSAYREVGQAVAGVATIANTGSEPMSLKVDTATSDHRWSAIPGEPTVEIPAGGAVEVALDIRILPDAAADQPVRISVRARDADGAQATGAVEVATDPSIEAVGPWQAWTVPQPLLGGLNVAGTALGGAPVAPLDPEREAQLYDGVTPSGSGFRGSFDGPPVSFTVDLAGEAPVPVAGTILNPLAGRTSQESVPRRFTFLLSGDGVTWQEVLQGELTPLADDQAFALPEAIDARFAQLRIDTVWGGPGNEVTLGEWKVVATPGTVPDPMPTNIAAPARGGHVVWMRPQVTSQDEADAMLLDDSIQRYPMYAKEGERLSWVLGFQDDREALLERLEWRDPDGSNPAIRIRRVEVEAGDSPIGPWTPLGTWRLERADDGTVAPLELPDGTWTRFLRFTSGPVRKGTFQLELPAALRAIEHPTDDTYRSILGEWGNASALGPRDLLEPPSLVDAPAPDLEDDGPASARPLVAGTTARDRVHRGEDEDWYTVTIPEGQASVTFTVSGDPSVGVALTLFDDTGQAVPMAFEQGSAPGTVEYRANVRPGASYHVRVEQPPFSAVFTFDTSGSMGDYLSFVMQAMGSYAGAVTPGEEQVLIIPFDEDALLKEWSDDAYLLQDAVGRFRGAAGSSSAEFGLLESTEALEGREGARAVLMVTDAETSSYDENQRLWQELEAVRPMVFTVHVGADGKPVEARHFMQDWAMAGFGRYQYALSHGDMDRAFDRMATWLRRPATYGLRFDTSTQTVPPPPPGTLSVVAPQEADGTTSAVVGPDVAVEIVLDTSGSMLQRFGGERRIDIAKRVLADMVRRDLPAGLPVAMRTFVRERRSCATELAVPLGPLDPEALATHIEGLDLLRTVRTPLARAIRAVGSDLEGVTGPRIVIVVSDGAESCGGNPAREVRRLKEQGVDVTLNVVGLALEDSKVRRSIRRLAALGGGSYFDARDPAEVAAAIRTAVSAPFQVFDQAGTLVARGTVGGAAVELPPGIYRVVVLTDPRMTYEGIVIDAEGSVTVTLPSAGERPVEPEAPEPSMSPAPGS
ncbi:MAG: hypothetical protein ABWZ82_09220 [Candidatus Limnocylindrales bacterium]